MNRFIVAPLLLVGSILLAVSFGLTQAPVPDGTDLYNDVRGMAYMANNFAYSWAYLKQIAKEAHESGKGMEGFEMDNDGTIVQSARSLGDIIKVYEDNKELIENSKTFGEKLTSNNFNEFVEDMKDIDIEGDSLVLQRYDDMNQDEELVYSISTDEINNRIIVTFRGTENSMAFGSNWGANIDILKVTEDVPALLKGEFKSDTVSIHKGFHTYMHKESLQSGKSFYDEITRQVKNLLQNSYTKYTSVYVTGHSLGAALSTLYSYYIASDPDIPGPVKCINFASPRVGDRNFLQAVQHLEKTQRLQMIRVVNDNDVVPTVPTIGFSHVGFQIKLYSNLKANKEKDPDMFYPSKDHGIMKWMKQSLSNRVPVLYAPAVGREHAGTEYTRRLESSMTWFKSFKLDKLYIELM
eukprot:CAMPEP_0198285666 /NCGR_PEP_ID=MMETSP1449-20131203/4910_1 /TAXON_ID=420275 /ORGANISM="Attheya septentrionalis, Strain CCMP2084" /LENGTH=408 /DNA_ID=CAMNT_0043983163 /DNA_START=87 /DNA_END=1313 /DNA_ORIENTATION=+